MVKLRCIRHADILMRAYLCQVSDTCSPEPLVTRYTYMPWLSDIVLSPPPPMIKKREKPKGLTQTVIVLPKKPMRSSKCAPFQKKFSIEIECLILECREGLCH